MILEGYSKIFNFLQENSIRGNPPVPQDAQSVSTIPPFKPIPPAAERPSVSDSKSVPSPAVVGVAVPTFSAMPSSISRMGPVSVGKPDVMAVVVPVAKGGANKGELQANFLKCT